MIYYNDWIEFKTSNGEVIRIGFDVFGTIFKNSDGSLRKPGNVVIDYKGETKMVTTGTIYKFQYDELEDRYRCKIFISHLNKSVPRLFIAGEITEDGGVYVNTCTIDLGDVIFTTNQQVIEESSNADDHDTPIFYGIKEYTSHLSYSSITHKDIYNMRIEKNH